MNQVFRPSVPQQQALGDYLNRRFAQDPHASQKLDGTTLLAELQPENVYQVTEAQQSAEALGQQLNTQDADAPLALAQYLPSDQFRVPFVLRHLIQEIKAVEARLKALSGAHAPSESEDSPEQLTAQEQRLNQRLAQLQQQQKALQQEFETMGKGWLGKLKQKALLRQVHLEAPLDKTPSNTGALELEKFVN